MKKSENAPVELVTPMQSLASRLATLIGTHDELLFSVAYVTEKGLSKLLPALRKRLSSPKAHVRIMIQLDRFRTDPEALGTLQEHSKRCKGSLQLYSACDGKFHAKLFAFRKKHDVTVVIGSANLTSKAMSAHSGELGVVLGPSPTSTAAWEEMARAFTPSRLLDRTRLAKYAALYKNHTRATAKAKLPVWDEPVEPPAVPWDSPKLFLTNMYDIPPKEQEAASAAFALARIPEPRNCRQPASEKGLRHTPPDRCCVEFSWKGQATNTARHLESVAFVTYDHATRVTSKGKKYWGVGVNPWPGKSELRLRTQAQSDAALGVDVDTRKWLQNPGSRTLTTAAERKRLKAIVAAVEKAAG